MSTEDPPRGDRYPSLLAPEGAGLSASAVVSPSAATSPTVVEDSEFELDFIKSSSPPVVQEGYPSVAPAVADANRAELVFAVDAALARFAANGSTTLAGDHLLLRSGPTTAREDARFAISRWDRLDATERERVAIQLARKLVSSIKSTMPPSQAKPTFRIDGGLLALILGSCAVVLALSYWTFWSESPIGKRVHSRSTQAAAVSSPPRTAQYSVPGVCEATLARIFRGGLISMADADGWVVELAVLGPTDPGPAETSVELRKFLEPQENGRFRYVWSEEPGLAMSNQPQPPVKVRSITLPTQEKTYHGLTISFEGSFVESYFDEIGREKFYHIAHSISSALRAKHVALYARCAHDDVHTLGSWFQGDDSAGVASSLLYFMGMHAAPRHLDPMHYRDRRTQQLDLGHAFSAILHASTHLDRKALSTLVGSEGGMAVGADKSVVVTFPFRDGNRATRVSRTMARVTGLSRENLDQQPATP